MCTSLGCWARLRLILALIVCVWLGLAPIAAAASLRQPESECCCGSGSVCLISGCDCGRGQANGPSRCGGLRSSSSPEGAAVSPLGHLLGLAEGDSLLGTIPAAGRPAAGDHAVLQDPPNTPDPPPPRAR